MDPFWKIIYHQKNRSILENTIPLTSAVNWGFSSLLCEVNAVSAHVFFLHPLTRMRYDTSAS